MHLLECCELMINSFWSMRTAPAIRSCFSSSLFKSTTSFYGYDERLLGGPLFGLLCWSYTLAGILMILVRPKWAKNSSFPFTSFGLILIFIQGPLSFKADYVNMANDSIYHVVDRFVAVTNTILYFGKVSTYFWHARISIIASQTIALMITMTCFVNSQRAQMLLNTEDFCMWHSLWHLCGLCSAFVDIIEVFVIEKKQDTESRMGSILPNERQSWWKAFMNYGADENCSLYKKINKDV